MKSVFYESSKHLTLVGLQNETKILRSWRNSQSRSGTGELVRFWGVGFHCSACSRNETQAVWQ